MAKAIEQIVETYVRYNSPTECLRNERPRHQFNDLSHPPGHDERMVRPLDGLSVPHWGRHFIG